jgi:hypothetical protein
MLRVDMGAVDLDPAPSISLSSCECLPMPGLTLFRGDLTG